MGGGAADPEDPKACTLAPLETDNNDDAVDVASLCLWAGVIITGCVAVCMFLHDSALLMEMLGER